MIKIIHLIVGILGLIIFVLTGQYMDIYLGHLHHGMADGPRMMYRSAHIYILWAALLNLVLGLYLAPLAGKYPRWLQVVGSAAIMASFACVIWSFFTESWHLDLQRNIMRSGLYLALAGGVAHALSALFQRWIAQAAQD